MKTFEEFKAALNEGAFAETLKAAEGTEAAKDKIAFLVNLARENGYEVTAEDFACEKALTREMDDSELDTVNGGYNPEDCKHTYDFTFSCSSNDYCTWSDNYYKRREECECTYDSTEFCWADDGCHFLVNRY